MSKIEELIAEYCPEGVEWKILGENVKILRGRRLTKSLLSIEEKYPVFHGGLEPLGFYGESNRSRNTVMIINVGASAGTVGFSNVDFWSSDGCYCLENTGFLNSRFAYHFLLTQENILKSKVRKAGIPTLDAGVIEKITIPIPPLPVQEEIVSILDKFTSLEAELEAELEARTRQYEYYRNQLLAFEGKEVKWKALGEVCLKTSNIKWKENIETSYKYIDLSAVNRDNNQIEELTLINSENAPSRAQQIVETHDIIFGTTRPTLKRYAIIPGELNGQICSTGFCVFRPNTDLILPKFLFFVLKSQAFFEYVENNQEGAGYPSISNTKVKNFKFYIPSLQEQERIVSILDKFDALVNDISVGLPAEIQARRQQYEYYRGKLLTFEPLTA